MSRYALLVLLAVPALAVAGGPTSVTLKLDRAEAAAVEADAKAIYRLEVPLEKLSLETSAVVLEGFDELGVHEHEASCSGDLWPPTITCCAPAEGGYATCCHVSTSEAYCYNSSSD